MVSRLATCGVAAAAYLVLCGLHSADLIAAAPVQDSLATYGKQTARIVCSRCHVVSSDQEFSPDLHEGAPSFDEIANRRGVSETSLRHFIATTHWDGQTIPMTMPAPDLSKHQTEAVAHYIMSLRKP